MNRWVWASFLLLAVWACTGCGNEAGQADNGNWQSRNIQSEITLYTHRYLPQEEQLIRQFTTRNGVKVNVVLLDEAEILRRARAGELSGGDVVLMPSLEDITALKEAGTLQPFYVDNFSTGEIPDRFTDREGYWAALSHWTMAAVYRANTVDYEQVKHYRFLAMPDFEGRLLVSPPDSSGLTGLVAGILASKGPEAADLWTRLLAKHQARTPAGNEYDLLWAVARGEADLAIVNSSAYFRWQRSGNPEAFKLSENLRMRYPVDVDNNNYYNAVTIGLLADAPNRDAAMKYINFLFSKESQELLSASTQEYPGHVYAMPSDFLMDFADLPAGNVSLEQIEQHLPQARQLVERYFGGR